MATFRRVSNEAKIRTKPKYRYEAKDILLKTYEAEVEATLFKTLKAETKAEATCSHNNN